MVRALAGDSTITSLYPPPDVFVFVPAFLARAEAVPAAAVVEAFVFAIKDAVLDTDDEGNEGRAPHGRFRGPPPTKRREEVKRRFPPAPPLPNPPVPAAGEARIATTGGRAARPCAGAV